MRIARFLSERLLQLAYVVAWTGFWAQVPAFLGAALIAMPRSADGALGAAVALIARGSLILGAIFMVGGVLLLLVRFRWRATGGPGEREPARSARHTLLMLSLLALATAAIATSPELLALWREALVLLDRAGLRGELSHPGQFSGVVLGPIMALLYTPIVVGLAASTLIVLPALLAIALAARSPRFHSLFASAVICCSVLVAAGLVATDLFQRVLTLFAPTLRNDPDPMGARVADQLTLASAVLLRTARTQAVILLGHLAWLPSVLMDRPVSAEAAADPATASMERPGDGGAAADGEPHTAPPVPVPGAAPSAPEPVVAGGEEKPQPPGPRSDEALLDFHERIRRLREQRQAGTPAPASWASAMHGFAHRAMLILGVLMFAVGLVDLLRPRANWVRSSPAPGSTLADAPRRVTVTFGRPLAPGSTLSVTQTLGARAIGGEPAGGAGEITPHARIDPNDPRTLQAELVPNTGEGLYWVRWRATSARWGVPRHGTFAFRVGSSIPESYLGESGRPDREVDERQRQRRSALIAGVLLAVLGVALPGLQVARTRG